MSDPSQNTAHVALDFYAGRSDTSERHFVPHGSVIVEILHRGDRSRARNPCRHSRIFSVSHMEFDVGKNSRAPDGLGSADNPRAPESGSQAGPGLCLRFLGDLPPARMCAIRSGNQSRREAPYLNQGDHLPANVRSTRARAGWIP